MFNDFSRTREPRGMKALAGSLKRCPCMFPRPTISSLSSRDMLAIGVSMDSCLRVHDISERRDVTAGKHCGFKGMVP
jgi:hypothetical protein